MKRAHSHISTDNSSYTVSDHTRSKKPKLSTYELPSHRRNVEYISATHTRNFILKDSLVDWLKEHGAHSNTSYQNSGGFASFIMERGIKFESEIVKYINHHKLPIVTVSQMKVLTEQFS